MATTKILVVDNYDSFVFNLVQYLGQLGAETTVVRNDEISVEAALDYDGVLISPGPGTPEAAGISIAMIKFCAEKKIQFCDYPHYKSVAQNDCLKHLKEHRISWYLIFDIPGFQSLCSDMGEDQFQLYFGQDKNIGEYLINLSSHPEIRNFIRKGLKLIEKKLANQVRMS
jgi:hypothetical protein